LLGLVLELITDASLTWFVKYTLWVQWYIACDWSIGSFLHESRAHSLLYLLPSTSRPHCRIASGDADLSASVEPA